MKIIFKIILFRQVLIPIIILFLLALFLPKVTVILAAKTTVDPKILTAVFVYSMFVVVLGIWFVWYPFTCISIWKASKNIRPGWLPKLAKVYAAIILIVIIVPGIYALQKLPEIFSDLEAHDAVSGTDVPPAVL